LFRLAALSAVSTRSSSSGHPGGHSRLCRPTLARDAAPDRIGAAAAGERPRALRPQPSTHPGLEQGRIGGGHAQHDRPEARRQQCRAPKNSKSAKVRFTVMSRVSTSASPAPAHRPRRVSSRAMSGLGRRGGLTPIARISASIAYSGNPPPGMSHA
jgi:hypothetical protein